MGVSGGSVDCLKKNKTDASSKSKGWARKRGKTEANPRGTIWRQTEKSKHCCYCAAAGCSDLSLFFFFLFCRESQGFIANVCSAPVSAETAPSNTSCHDTVMSDASGSSSGIKASVFSDTPHSWHFSMCLSVESRVFLRRVWLPVGVGQRSPMPPQQVSVRGRAL